ncbi:MAG: lipocalin family protein [Lentisphaeria bacterium]|nr:lipocalin family protein [Lentisphaeria bacterium]
MKKKRFLQQIFNALTAAGCTLLFSSCMGEKSTLEPVSNFNLEKYMGSWYEIARTPNPFEKNLIAVKATYTLEKNGSVKVVNSGLLPDGKRKYITGKAFADGKEGEGLLKVSFFRPFYGEYKIVKLSPRYKYSIVVSGKKYLWVLARSSTLTPAEKEEILEFLEKNSLETEKLIWSHV